MHGRDQRRRAAPRSGSPSSSPPAPPAAGPSSPGRPPPPAAWSPCPASGAVNRPLSSSSPRAAKRPSSSASVRRRPSRVRVSVWPTIAAGKLRRTAVALDPDPAVGDAAAGVQLVVAEPRGEAARPVPSTVTMCSSSPSSSRTSPCGGWLRRQASRRCQGEVQSVPGTGGGAGRARLSATVASAASSSVGGSAGARRPALPCPRGRASRCRAASPGTGAGGGRAQEGEIGRDALDLRRVERRGQPLQRRGPVGAMGDDLGDHRVVVGRHRVALLDAGVDAHAVQPRGQRSVRSRPIDGRKPRAGSSA